MLLTVLLLYVVHCAVIFIHCPVDAEIRASNGQNLIQLSYGTIHVKATDKYS